MEFVNLKPINRICPRCGNGNYMRIISGKNVGKLNVKCINCNSYYNYDELLKRDNSKPLNGANGRTMDDLISRAAAIDAIVSATAFPDAEYIKNLCQNPANSEDWLGGVCDAINAVEDVNTVDAVPVEWLKHRLIMTQKNGSEVPEQAIRYVLWLWEQQHDGERRNNDGKDA